MKKFFILLALALFIDACKTVPVTGRKQVAFISNNEMLSLSDASYQNVLADSKLSTNQAQTQMIKRVGEKISKGVEKFFEEKNMASQLEGYQWEFNLIESDQVNAWCMPGGKVAFYTGIMPICEDENGVAVVMGHEIAHAVANHGNERMSQALLQQYGEVALATAMQNSAQTTQALALQAYGVGSTYLGVLPYSRLQESEADQLGLIFMAMAGYDPNHAPAFWERMQNASGGNEPLEFFSTHPSSATRIESIKRQIPEAMQYYKPQ
ncbi:M48 family metallopeptidase [Xanthovirga aplysinae]|uniref:M48 family metallopeptidase n=1 Tax=Xanthovirga aplysinae TaxID=2529853 RepID=UPI0012BBCFC5|nr:M48 family metallopeptidase [Xanthovirga aplysinae]MTI30784.1 M48 family peptidase [Xanthovirga aplysinae]